MRGVFITIFLMSLLFIAGCGMTGNVVYCNKPYLLVGDSCCLDKNDNSICDSDDVSETVTESVDPPMDEEPVPVVEEVVEPVIEDVEPEVVEEEPTEMSNYMKAGDSVFFGPKKVTLTELSSYNGLLKASVDVDGISKDLEGSRNPKLINGVIITLGRYEQLKTSVELIIEPLVLEPNEYILNRYNQKSIKVLGEEIELDKILDDKGTIQLNLETSGHFRLDIKKGATKEIESLKITNVKPFFDGYRYNHEVIIKVVKA